MDQESHTEKIGVGKKVKRLSNKRERGQVKNYLKGYSIEDYENCIAMWNLKNQSYIVMSEEVPNSIVINVEDFHSNQLGFHTNLASLLDKKDVPLTEMNNYVNGRGWHEDKDISSSLNIPQLDSDLVEIINASLSQEIMERCNYEILK